MSSETEAPAVEEVHPDVAARNAQAAAQQTVVPEQRPQSFNQAPAVSPLTDRILKERAERGFDDQTPMPQSAYDAANDPKRIKKTASEGLSEVPFPGTVLRVTEGLNRGRLAVVLRVISYVDESALIAANSRVPSAMVHEAHPAELEVSFRGDDRDGEHGVLNLVDVDNIDYAQYEIVRGGFTGRGASVSGAVV